MYIPHCVYLFVRWWTFELCPFGCCESSNAAVHVRVRLSVWVSAPLDGHPEGDLLDPLCFICWRTAVQSSTAASVFYIPTSNAQGFQFFLANTFLCFWIIAILMSMQWYLMVLIFYIPNGNCCGFFFFFFAHFAPIYIWRCVLFLIYEPHVSTVEQYIVRNGWPSQLNFFLLTQVFERITVLYCFLLLLLFLKYLTAVLG